MNIDVKQITQIQPSGSLLIESIMETAKIIFAVVVGILFIAWIAIEVVLLIAMAKSDAKPSLDPNDDITEIDL